MGSPQLAWEFMKKLANSPWAPIIRLINEPEIVGTEPNLELIEDLEDCAVVAEETASNLKEDLEDCAVVVEETDCPVQKKTANAEESSEDSDSVPRYCPSASDSDESVDVVDDSQIEWNKLPAIVPLRDKKLETPTDGSSTGSHRRARNKPKPKSKKRILPSSADPSKAKDDHSPPSSPSGDQVSRRNEETIVPVREGSAPTKFEYNGQFLKLKSLKIVLIDLAKVNERYGSARPLEPLESSEEEGGGTANGCGKAKINSKPLVISSDESSDENSKASSSSNAGSLKRPLDFCWGLDSIQELKKRRKLVKPVRKNYGAAEEVELVTPCSTELGVKAVSEKSVINSKPEPSSGPNNFFGLNAWRLGLVMQELTRLQELAESLQKTPMKPEAQKQVAYKFKYGLNEVARLVTKKSLNSIVEKHEKLEKVEEMKSRFLDEESAGKETAPGGGFSTEATPSSESKQLCKVGSRARSTSKELQAPGPGRPIVDVHMPTLVQGVAAGFLRIFDRLERLESHCKDIEKTVSKSKDSSQSIDLSELD